MLEISKELLKIIEDNGYKAYIVGGFVRDIYLNRESIDVDICTNAKPMEIQRMFNNVKLDSKEYGSVSLRYKGIDFEITKVNMGNPHCVIFVEDLNKIDVSKWGPIIENDSMFPHKTNVEFVQVINDSTMKMKVWERGAGITLACGTGACATLVAGVINNKTSMKAEVILSGGTLLIEWPDKKKIYMTGPAELVFKGEII